MKVEQFPSLTPREAAPADASGKRTFVVPIGPQHPALKEPGHFQFSVDGEIVTNATVRLGYVHRGIEKGAENRNYTQGIYLFERVCGICSHVHATAFTNGTEKLLGISAPPRAQAIRGVAGYTAIGLGRDRRLVENLPGWGLTDARTGASSSNGC